MVHGIAESNIISVTKHDAVLSKTGPNDVLVKVDKELEETERFHQEQHQDKGVKQDVTSTDENLFPSSGLSKFISQQMYDQQIELIHVTESEDQLKTMNVSSQSVQMPEKQQESQVMTIPHIYK